MPLTVSNGSSIGYVSAEGHWRPTDNAPDKQLVNKIAVKLRCEREQHVCREIDASLFMGVLTPDLTEYEISSWTDTGIVADASDDSECGIGNRLSIDFKANSVIVTDYPKKVGGKNFAACPAKHSRTPTLTSYPAATFCSTVRTQYSVVRVTAQAAP